MPAARDRSQKTTSPLAVAFLALCFAGGFATAAVVRHVQRRGAADGGSGEEVGSGGPTDASRVPPAPTSDPQAPMRHFQAGVAHREAGNLAAALEEFREASRLDPAAPGPHHFMGKVYQDMVLEDKAELAFRRALELDPGFLPAKESLVKILHNLGRYEEAIDMLEKMQKAYPENNLVLAELAINALALGDASRAIALLEKYNAAQGRQAWGYTELGRAYAAAGETTRAEASYREALSIDPRFTVARYWLGQLLAAEGREEESRPLLESYQKLRGLETRSQRLRMALLHNPEHVPTIVELARTRYLLGRVDEALKLLERARRLAPDDAKLKELEDNVRRAAGR